MKQASTTQRSKSAKEALVELVVASVVVLPLGLPFLWLGWRLAQRFEFDHRVKVAAAALSVVAITTELLVGGPTPYASAWVALVVWPMAHHGAPQARQWGLLLVVTAMLATPVGFGLRHLYEHLAGKHPLHGPEHQRRRRSRRMEHRAKAASSPADVPLVLDGQFVLGPWLDGDQGTPARAGRWAVVPEAAHHLLVLGATGAGKSVTIERLVCAAMATGHRVIFIDAKEDPSAGQRLAALAVDLGIDRNRIRTWPLGGPMDLWRGDAQQILDRAFALSDWSEPWFAAVAASALRLAVADPRGLPRSLGEMLGRLDSGHMKGTWAGTPYAEVAAKLTPELVAGVKLRYFGLDQALKAVGAVPSDDSARGWAIDDCDFAYVSLPTSTVPVVAAGFGRAVLLDVMTWLRSPQRRGDARPVLLVVEELGALVGSDEVTGRTIAEMVERARSAGCRVILSGQSLGSFGSEEMAQRLLHSGASTLCMRLSDPEQVLCLIGTRRQAEASLGVTVAGTHLEQGSMRIQEVFAVAPDELRTLPMGRAYLFHHGRFTLAQVARVG